MVIKKDYTHTHTHIWDNKMTNKMVTALLLIIINTTYASPSSNRFANNIVGEATNIVAANILKSNIDVEKNFVFSPIGFSTILSILGEGSRKQTKNDILTFLKYPDFTATVQSAYKTILKDFQGDNARLAPQFKTWMYIYRNNSIENEFKNIIENNYYVEVKTIDRDYYNWNDPNTFEPINLSDDVDDAAAEDDDDDDDEEVEEDKKMKENETSISDSKVKPNKIVSTTPSNSKDIPEFETLKKRAPNDDDETRRIVDDQKDSSKFDEVIEDKQYVEVPIIKKELSKNIENNESVKNDNDMIEIDAFIKKQHDKKLKTNKKSINPIQNSSPDEKSEPEKIKIPLTKLKNLEFISHGSGRNFGSRSPMDITSVISGNSIVGEKSKSNVSNRDRFESKMLLFNGLYYKGSWALPFQQLRSGPGNIFYTSETEKINVKMMKSCGYYKIAVSKDSQAISLQYDNERYALLIIVPNARDGLKQLIKTIDSYTIGEILENMNEELIELSIPKFNIETTSGAEKSFARTGLAGIFTSKADFSGVTQEQKLHIEELQQHVVVSVDEGQSSQNSLSASMLRSNNNDHSDHTVVIDRPFLFYVLDQVNNVILVAGKIVQPPIIHDEPI